MALLCVVYYVCNLTIVTNYFPKENREFTRQPLMSLLCYLIIDYHSCVLVVSYSLILLLRLVLCCLSTVKTLVRFCGVVVVLWLWLCPFLPLSFFSLRYGKYRLTDQVNGRERRAFGLARSAAPRVRCRAFPQKGRGNGQKAPGASWTL
ncbi:TPA_asm: hypothetical protein vir530_00023 [dsDNA virus vir530]|nr:TPA_asm: hypothetical protein vir530_00023 [dsDNA virus vir530]